MQKSARPFAAFPLGSCLANLCFWLIHSTFSISLAATPINPQNTFSPKNQEKTLTPAPRPDAPPLAARGTFQVGVKTITITDPSRKRDLTLEVWYPAQLAAGQLEQTVYNTTIGALPIKLKGQALRDAPAKTGKYPLIIVSHGQPGTRFMLSYLTESLASRGFVVAALDHTGSTYSDISQPAFVSSIADRPLDLLLALEQVPKQFPHADGQNVGLVGYSYGGYSALNAAGVGLSKTDLEGYCKTSNNEGPCFVLPYFDPLEAVRGAKHAKPDPRIKAVMVMAPYGAPWLSQAALKAMRVPLLVAGGSADDIATFARDAKTIFTRSGSPSKYLLTLEGAMHNPWVNPAPLEARADWGEYERWSEPVWDKERANDVTKHFAAAFFGGFLQNKPEAKNYLSSELPGFKPRTTEGVTLELGK
jgi:predicted dienelactone hydrolase